MRNSVTGRVGECFRGSFLKNIVDFANIVYVVYNILLYIVEKHM